MNIFSTQKKKVLAKALFNTCEYLKLNQPKIASILGVSQSQLMTIKVHMEIEPMSKQGELALLFIRLFNKLYKISGGDLDWIQHFLNSQNRITGGVPIKQIESTNGLVSVLQFVESI